MKKVGSMILIIPLIFGLCAFAYAHTVKTKTINKSLATY